jgi:hypothetical protein
LVPPLFDPRVYSESDGIGLVRFQGTLQSIFQQSLSLLNREKSAEAGECGRNQLQLSAEKGKPVNFPGMKHGRYMDCS